MVPNYTNEEWPILNDLSIKGYSKEMVYPFLENISLNDEKNIQEIKEKSGFLKNNSKNIEHILQ